ncbi:hypothetical protein Tsubulata_000304, partial [Turnera subulata]
YRDFPVSSSIPQTSLTKTQQQNHVNITEINAQLNALVKAGQLTHARHLFDKMPHRDEGSWTAMIWGYVNAMDTREALSLFLQMWVQPGLRMDSFVLSPACADLGALDCGREIHCLTMRKGIDMSSFVANNLATVYNKCGKLEYGLRLFGKMSMRDVVSWTMIITASVQAGQEENGISAFLRMREKDVSPNEYTFSALVEYNILGYPELAQMKFTSHRL